MEYRRYGYTFEEPPAGINYFFNTRGVAIGVGLLLGVVDLWTFNEDVLLLVLFIGIPCWFLAHLAEPYPKIASTLIIIWSFPFYLIVLFSFIYFDGDFSVYRGFHHISSGSIEYLNLTIVYLFTLVMVVLLDTRKYYFNKCS